MRYPGGPSFTEPHFVGRLRAAGIGPGPDRLDPLEISIRLG
jgi:hypothetical protein